MRLAKQEIHLEEEEGTIPKSKNQVLVNRGG